MTLLEQLGAWPARALWLALALLSTGSLADALDGRSTAVALVARVGLAVGWGGGLVALLVPRSSALTALRVLVPAGLAAALAALVAGSTTDGADVAAIAVAAVAAAWVLAPWIGGAWVDGSSYGSERRLLLRPPALFTFALVPLTWLVVVLGAAVGPLLLAARQWALGAVVLVLGWAAAAAGVRSLHQLARRWVVLVPTGLVVHDPLTMPEAQLFLRTMVHGLGPAPVDVEADDLTAGAPGLALLLTLDEPAELLLRSRGRDTATRTSTAILITPSRPEQLLDAARQARIPVT
ncbi:hypothetical protein KSP35_10220 [Aquihabitans sp. G128]|uniref:hypothetical protein n=1 Tax=Aquihabitans sp. G128 TaxID=2849779 RepID=UPI001C24E9A9|nr:hypothetical protein [Aquihabitans sp. G128]QXC63116.1 hypothetical protein KSP35_10220 [Aquihabitans sp. G128]